MMMKPSSLPSRIMVAATEVAEPSKRATGFKCVLAQAYPSTEQIERAVARSDVPCRLAIESARILFRSVVPTAPAVQHGDETQQKPLWLFPVSDGFLLGYAEILSAFCRPFIEVAWHWLRLRFNNRSNIKSTAPIKSR